MSFSFPDFDSSYRIRTSTTSFANGWTTGTFMSWVRFNNTTSDQTIFHIGTAFGTNQPLLLWRDDVDAVLGREDCLSLIMVFTPGGEARVISSTGSVGSANVWYHIACSFNSNNAGVLRWPQLYINGLLNVYGNTGTIPASGSVLSTTGFSLNLARPSNFAPSRHIHGFMEDIRVYDRQLSGDEIATIYRSDGKDTIVNGLVVRTLSNLGASGIDVPSSVPDISPLTTNLVADAALTGRLVLSDNFVLSQKRNPQRIG